MGCSECGAPCRTNKTGRRALTCSDLCAKTRKRRLNKERMARIKKRKGSEKERQRSCVEEALSTRRITEEEANLFYERIEEAARIFKEAGKIRRFWIDLIDIVSFCYEGSENVLVTRNSIAEISTRGASISADEKAFHRWKKTIILNGLGSSENGKSAVTIYRQKCIDVCNYAMGISICDFAIV